MILVNRIPSLVSVSFVRQVLELSQQKEANVVDELEIADQQGLDYSPCFEGVLQPTKNIDTHHYTTA